MSVSYQMVLMKMQKEINEALQTHSETAIRERIYGIKTLCDLVLEEDREIRKKPLQTVSQSSRTVIEPPKVLKMEEGANGDSIFDF